MVCDPLILLNIYKKSIVQNKPYNHSLNLNMCLLINHFIWSCIKYPCSLINIIIC